MFISAIKVRREHIWIFVIENILLNLIWHDREILFHEIRLETVRNVFSWSFVAIFDDLFAIFRHFPSFSVKNSLFYRAVQLEPRFWAKMEPILTNVPFYHKMAFLAIFGDFQRFDCDFRPFFMIWAIFAIEIMLFTLIGHDREVLFHEIRL